MFKILGMGNALTDVLVQLPSDELLAELGLPRGSMQLIDKKMFEVLQHRIVEMPKQLACGGSAANTMTGVSKMGIKSGFVGKVHPDAVGDHYRNDLLNHGVEPHMLEDGQSSGQCLVFISPDGQRTFATFLGAAAALGAHEIKPSLFTGYDLFYIEGYLVQNHELIQAAIVHAKTAGLRVALDLASYNVVEDNKDFLCSLIETHVDLVFANEEEAMALTGMEPAKALAWIAERVEIAIVKLGEKGAMACSGNETVGVPAVQATCVDTTGAGDLFAAGFLYGLASGKSLTDCLRYGTIAAGKVVEYIGPKLDQAGWDAVLSHY